MAYLISDIKNTNPVENERYFFDANVWLAILYSFYNEPYYHAYKIFFNKIINNKIAPSARIVMPSLLVSELINRIIRDIYFYEFCNDNGITKNALNFKTVYRKAPEYVSDFDEVCSGIRDYENKIDFVSDGVDGYKCEHLIKDIPHHLDFNDFVYSKIAKREDLILVTNDADFKVENIRILTTHQALISLT
jgi:predicted nucleic acid-binding protein